MRHGRTKITAVDRIEGLLYGLMVVGGLTLVILGLTWFFTAFPWADFNDVANWAVAAGFAGGGACYLGHEFFGVLALDKTARDTWTKRVPWDPASVRGTATRVDTLDEVPPDAVFGHDYDRLVIDDSGRVTWTEE
jgi:hypothetical protein